MVKISFYHRLHIIYTSLKIMKCWVKFRIFDLLIIPKRINVKILIHELSIMTYFCYHLLVKNRENKFVLVELVFNHIKNHWYRIVIANIKYRKVLRNCNGTKYIKCGIALCRNLRLGYPGQIIKHASQIWLVATGGFNVYAIFCFSAQWSQMNSPVVKCYDFLVIVVVYWSLGPKQISIS